MRPKSPKTGTRAVHSPPTVLRSGLFSEQAWAGIAASLNLSPREAQIVREMFDDQTEFAMARNLGIARSTIHTHVERLHRKLRVTDRSLLLIRIMQEFLALTVSPEHGLPPICRHQIQGHCPLSRKP
jgi:DNA-binding CsgD family transcriptional regulator